MRSGVSGIAPIAGFDASGFGSQVAGEVRDFRPTDFIGRREFDAFSPYVHFGIAAARMAWEDAGAIGAALDADRIGVCIGGTVAALGRAVSDGVTFSEKGISRVHPMVVLQYPGTLPSEVAIALGLRGPAYAVSTACTASADAIGLAAAQIQTGLLDAVVAGGSDAPLVPVLFAGFDRLQVLSRLNDPPQRASRPFSRDRNGFVLSEGAAIVLLEAEEVARERGARIYAEVSGFGATSDAHHHLHPASSGEQGIRAIQIAMSAAGVSAADIDYVNAHGTGTLKNDAIETRIFKEVFGHHAPEVPISSSKSMSGHLIGASAALEVVISALAIRDRIVPPTINLAEPDPECDLDYVTEGSRSLEAVDTVLSTSFGFGSRNAAIVLRSVR